MSGVSIAAIGIAVIVAAGIISRVRNDAQRPGMALTWATTPIWLRAIWLLNFLNFFAFVCGAVRLGGDAGNGYHVRDEYFLGAKGGFYIPVSRTVWLYSYYHSVSVWAFFFLAFLAVGWHMNRAARRSNHTMEPTPPD